MTNKGVLSVRSFFCIVAVGYLKGSFKDMVYFSLEVSLLGKGHFSVWQDGCHKYFSQSKGGGT